MLDIIAPESALQIYTPPLNGVQHPLAPQFVAALRHHGVVPVNQWRIVNSLARAQKPDSRIQIRCLRLRFLGAVRELVRAKVVYRHSGLIALRDFGFTPRSRLSKRMLLSVNGSPWSGGRLCEGIDSLTLASS